MSCLGLDFGEIYNVTLISSIDKKMLMWYNFRKYDEADE